MNVLYYCTYIQSIFVHLLETCLHFNIQPPLHGHFIDMQLMQLLWRFSMYFTCFYPFRNPPNTLGCFSLHLSLCSMKHDQKKRTSRHYFCGQQSSCQQIDSECMYVCMYTHCLGMFQLQMQTPTLMISLFNIFKQAQIIFVKKKFNFIYYSNKLFYTLQLLWCAFPCVMCL